MITEEPIYTKLQLKFDDRFTTDEKLSIYMTHYDMFESWEYLTTQLTIAMCTGIILDTLGKFKK